MRVHLYEGGLTPLVAQSGVGQAICHQRAMLAEAGVELTDGWKGRADAVHINTVLPDAPLAALRARLRGETVVWYGHSTMEDFRESFVGSNRLAPLFRRWLCVCYGLADVVVTPTPYSRRILEGYGLKKPVYALSNGVDTEFFTPDPARGTAWRARQQQRPGQKLVISVGHFMERKGILEFIDLARKLPGTGFIWYGCTSPALVSEPVRAAMAAAPENLTFAGFVSQAELRDAYCGADAFAFCSHEETEGIVVLEALACGVPVLVRDIPVYEGWLENGTTVYKARRAEDLAPILKAMLAKELPDLTAAGRRVAQARSLARVGQALCGIYEKEAAPCARPEPVGTAQIF